MPLAEAEDEEAEGADVFVGGIVVTGDSLANGGFSSILPPLLELLQPP